MSRTYLPNSKQMQRINEHLRTIAGAIGTQMDTSTWEGVQKIVETGLAPKVFPVGTQFIVNHSIYGDMVFDVVAHDYLKSTRKRDAHTMTIMSHDTIPDAVQFDGIEAFYFADSLEAGTYNFILPFDCYDWVKGTYYFTIEKLIDDPVQLTIARPTNQGLTSAKVAGYLIGTTEELFRVDIHSGDEGTNLGTLGVELNHPQRVYQGSNNYAASAIRQFLNSSAPVGQVYSRTHDYDRPPVWANTLAGFAHGLSSDFLSVVGEVLLPCATNNTYEGGYYDFAPNQKYTLTTDKFYLPSQMEIIGNSGSTVVDESIRFPYYDESTVTDRIKYKHGEQLATSWVMRSPHLNSASAVRRIDEKGWLTYTESPSSIAVVCTITGRF